MYGILNIVVCQGEWEHWKRRTLRTASPCYRAVTLLEEILKLSDLSVIYWFQIGHLTFDFPLQLGFNFGFSTVVSAKRLFVKGCFWYQVPAKLLCKIIQTPTSPFSLPGFPYSIFTPSYILQFRIVHLPSSLCKFLRCNLLPTHQKIIFNSFFFSFMFLDSVCQADLKKNTWSCGE